MAVPPHQTVFVHQTGIGDMLKLPTELDVPKLYVATCSTRYPAARCECGMFDLFWDQTVKQKNKS